MSQKFLFITYNSLQPSFRSNPVSVGINIDIIWVVLNK
jgi:hypothetical protein